MALELPDRLIAAVAIRLDRTLVTGATQKISEAVKKHLAPS